ncbi:hypothetical protein NJ56_00925 [Yersinia ruckeri]|nr:hypothetical protein NJ56_00925 [Yersinia ruckeri]
MKGKFRRIFYATCNKVASEIPSLRQTSGTDVPSLACFRAKTICSSVNRDFFIGTTSTQGSVYHAGILFLNGAGFWGRVKRKVAWIHPEESKSGQAIGVALNDTACWLLRDQIGNHKKWVFVHQKSSTKSDGTKAAEVRKMRVDGNTAWRLVLKRAGIDNFRFHDLRHTWASWLVQAGVPLTVLREMGGWESIEMVQRYAHLAPRHLSAHAKQIDNIFNGHVPNSSQLDNLELLKVV